MAAALLGAVGFGIFRSPSITDGDGDAYHQMAPHIVGSEQEGWIRHGQSVT